MKTFGIAKVVYTKTSASDLVTEADLVANTIFTEAIQKTFPSHGLVTEESPATGTDREYVWIVDPLDGTRNFFTGTPLFGIMAALTRQGVVTHAAICHPATNDLYVAVRGQGATKNGQSIHCSETNVFVHSFGCLNANFTAKRRPVLQKFLAVLDDQPFWATGFGSVAIAAGYVADGRRDWYFNTGGGIWDFAATALILAEAGCTVTDLNGQPWTLESKNLVAANPAMHPQLLSILTS